MPSIREAAAAYARALPLATDALADAESQQDRTLQGEARVVLGAIHIGAGKLEDGARELELAMRAGLAADDARLFARATAEHAYVAAAWLGVPDQALQELALARAALERVPGDRELAADLWSREGVAQRQAGRYPKAVEAFERALAMRQELHGADHPSVATALNNVANARTALGQLELMTSRDPLCAVYPRQPSLVPRGSRRIHRLAV